MTFERLVLALVLTLLAGCSSSGEDRDLAVDDMGMSDAGMGGSIVLDLTPMVDSWTVPQDNPAFSGSRSSLFCRFAADPRALRYTFESINPDSPPLEFTISWDPGNFGGEPEPVPDRGRFPAGENYIPGYDAGLVGTDYLIEISGAGTQCGLDPGCEADSQVAMDAEERLRGVGGSCRVTIDIAPEG
ncbi:MAG: hypothetical protein AAGH15_16270 [Myxococcota bacterium]